jgi:hypothetical protein
VIFSRQKAVIQLPCICIVFVLSMYLYCRCRCICIVDVNVEIISMMVMCNVIVIKNIKNIDRRRPKLPNELVVMEQGNNRTEIQTP